MKINLPLIAIFLVLLSCQAPSNEEALEGSISQDSNTSIEIEENFSLLNWEPNVYHNYFAETSKELGISALKADPFSEETFRDIFPDHSISKGDLVYKINGIDVNANTKKGILDMQSLYGTLVSFSIEKRNGTTFKDGLTSKNIDLYIPHLVTITKPEILNKSELYPHCFYKDLELAWNADLNNTEGLIVAAEYIGMSANPNRDKNEHIINTDFIKEDSGSWIINNDLWTGIPDTGIVHLILLRGNVDITEIDGELHKFFAETHAVSTIILIRDLNTLQ